jgi:hypothetical protein
MNLKAAFAMLLSLSLIGCASVKLGDKGREAELKRLQPVPGMVSLYVCREKALLVAAGVKTTVMVDNQPIGTLSPNNFAHAVLQAGRHDVYVRRVALGSSDSGKLTIDGKPGDVEILWVGVTGGGLGVLTIDRFDDRSAAVRCVQGAEYAVQADQ